MEKIENRPVVEVENGKIIRKWSSIRKAAKDLYLTRQTVANYCNNKTKKKQFNLKWETHTNEDNKK